MEKDNQKVNFIQTFPVFYELEAKQKKEKKQHKGLADLLPSADYGDAYMEFYHKSLCYLVAKNLIEYETFYNDRKPSEVWEAIALYNSINFMD